MFPAVAEVVEISERPDASPFLQHVDQPGLRGVERPVAPTADRSKTLAIWTELRKEELTPGGPLQKRRVVRLPARCRARRGPPGLLSPPASSAHPSRTSACEQSKLGDGAGALAFQTDLRQPGLCHRALDQDVPKIDDARGNGLEKAGAQIGRVIARQVDVLVWTAPAPGIVVP